MKSVRGRKWTRGNMEKKIQSSGEIKEGEINENEKENEKIEIKTRLAGEG